MYQQVAARKKLKRKASAPLLFRLRNKTSGGKRLFLAVSTATLFGCPLVKVKPSIAVSSALYSDMQVLRGLNVKSVMETKYSIVEKPGELVKGDFKYSEEIVFDDSLAIINSYNKKGALNWKKTFVFDGNKLMEVRTDSSDASLLKRVSYFYDESGNLLEINEYASDYTPLYKTAHWFDKSKNMLVVNEYSCDFKAGEKPPLDHVRKITRNYDEQGNPSINKYFKKDSIYRVEYYNYDDLGYVMTEENVRSDSSKAAYPVKVVYRYDKKDRLLEKNEYSSNGDLTGKTTYKYEFEKNDIWIKQTEFFSLTATGGESPVSITEREIKYKELSN